MRSPSLFFFCGFWFYCLCWACQDPEEKEGASTPQPPQADSLQDPANRYFGLHFDFHANQQDTIGPNLTAAQVDSLLQMVKPDFIQVDCRGHGGIASYPTDVSYQAAHYTQDPLRLFRKVTKKHQTALYCHYTGVYDRKVVSEHPEWAAQGPGGQPSTQFTSLAKAGPYYRNNFLAGMAEVKKRYDVDGFWVDGDCWAVVPDYSPENLRKYRRSPEAQNQKADSLPSSDAFRQYHRRRFREHLAWYMDSIHQQFPELRMASNWAYSSQMPEPVEANVDFLSGDLIPLNSLYSSLFESQCLAAQRQPWDLMAWGFSRTFDDRIQFGARNYKSALQLCQEACHPLALGGGFQVYFKQNRDASLQPWIFPIADSVARFVRKRQPLLEGAQPQADIALLYSRAGWAHNNPEVYRNWLKPTEDLHGVLNALADAGFAAQVEYSHTLSKERLQNYRAVAIPNWDTLAQPMQSRLQAYVKAGGKLFLVGSEISRYWWPELKKASEKITDRLGYLAAKKHLSTLNAPWLKIDTNSLGPGFSVLKTFYAKQDLRFPSSPAALTKKVGKGRVSALLFNLGAPYQNNKAFTYRDALAEFLEKGRLNWSVRTREPAPLHLVKTQSQDGQTLVSLINAQGPHESPWRYTYDQLPPLQNVTVEIEAPKPPQSLKLWPSGQKLEADYKAGKLRVSVPRVELMETLVIRWE